MPPVARLGDPQTCPAADGPTPHGSGAIVGPGAATVLAEGRPLAVVGDLAGCGGAPATLVGGSGTVLAQGRPVVRLGDPTSHGGVVVAGAATVSAG